MPEKILFVDDDPNILASMKRQLRGQFDLETAQSGEQGLEAISTQGPFAVIISDMQMPVMNGIEFLVQVKEIAPNSVRIMLTGNADMQTAIEAVNQGNIFQFLTKPCLPEVLIESLKDAIEQHKLINTDRDLLSKTLVSSIKTLNDILSIANPMAFGHASRITRYVKLIAQRMQYPSLWQMELAGILSQIGCIVLPQFILEKIYSNQKLSPNEQMVYSSHPSVGADLVTNIPRLGSIALMIKQQQKPFEDYTNQEGTTQGSIIDLGSQILKVAIILDQMIVCGYPYETTVSMLRQQPNQYNPMVVAALNELADEYQKTEVAEAKGPIEISESQLIVQNLNLENLAKYQKTEVTETKGPIQISESQPIVQNLNLENLAENHGINGNHRVENANKQNLRIKPENTGSSTVKREDTQIKNKVPKVDKKLEQFVKVKLENIKVGMIIAEDIWAKNDTLLLAKGQELTKTVLKRLYNFHETIGIKGGNFLIKNKLSEFEKSGEIDM